MQTTWYNRDKNQARVSEKTRRIAGNLRDHSEKGKIVGRGRRILQCVCRIHAWTSLCGRMRTDG